MITTTPTTWANKVMPPSFEECTKSKTRHAKRYDVQSSSYVLFIGALEAKKAKWVSRRVNLRVPTVSLPPENVAAIKLLDSWLSTPDVERDEWQERLERLIEENRL